MEAGSAQLYRRARPVRDRAPRRSRLVRARRGPSPCMNGRNRQRMISISVRALCRSSICALRTGTSSQSAVEGTTKRLTFSLRRQREDSIKSISTSQRKHQKTINNNVQSEPFYYLIKANSASIYTKIIIPLMKIKYIIVPWNFYCGHVFAPRSPECMHRH
jgi:hypothetical protein